MLSVPLLVCSSALRAVADFGESSPPDNAAPGLISHMGIAKACLPCGVLLLLPLLLSFR